MPLIAVNNTENHKRSSRLFHTKNWRNPSQVLVMLNNFISQLALLRLFAFQCIAYYAALKTLKFSLDGKGSPNTAAFY
jgi:hypothetical protein